jgi:hypothetical protein
MNELIKELSKQANAWYPRGYPSGEGGDAVWQNLVIFEKEDLQKFAELIAEECAKLCLIESQKWRGEQDITDFKLCAQLIRDKFQIS